MLQVYPWKEITDAIALLQANGYRVSKPKQKPIAKPLGLNAIGKPYGAGFDPHYRMKYKTPSPRIPLSSAANLRTAHYLYRMAIKQKYSDNVTFAKEICERNGVTWRD